MTNEIENELKMCKKKYVFNFFSVDDNDCYEYETCRINIDQETGKMSPGKCQVGENIFLNSKKHILLDSNAQGWIYV